jgi:hypothetical protein
VEETAPGTVVLDIEGLAHLLGSAHTSLLEADEAGRIRRTCSATVRISRPNDPLEAWLRA